MTPRQRVAATAVLSAALAGAAHLQGQRPTKGLNVAPVYEGWEPNSDGSFNLIFGYFNRNWDEWVNVPVGPENTLDPGGPDQGQPTRFEPRRNQFIFRVRVPKDFGTKEIVWTLTSNGKTERVYGTLKPDYVVDETVHLANTGAAGQLGTSPDLPGNRPPTLEVKGENTRRVRVGESVPLTAIATDDGKPKVRPMPSFTGIPQSYRTPRTDCAWRGLSIEARGMWSSHRSNSRRGKTHATGELAVGRRLEPPGDSTEQHVGRARHLQHPR